MNKKEVIELMKSSKTEEEWNSNTQKVRDSCGGYPDFWFAEIIASGLIDRTALHGATPAR